jgi:hypothetical protein
MLEESSSNSLRKTIEKGLPTFGESSTSSKKDSSKESSSAAPPSMRLPPLGNKMKINISDCEIHVDKNSYSAEERLSTR